MNHFNPLAAVVAGVVAWGLCIPGGAQTAIAPEPAGPAAAATDQSDAAEKLCRGLNYFTFGIAPEIAFFQNRYGIPGQLRH